MKKTYQISDLEAVSGIKAPTIRMWEMRYNLISPARSDSNRRYYDEETFKKFLLIVQLYYSNVKISQIAKFSLKELEHNAIEIVKTTEDFEPWTSQLLSAIVDFNQVLLQNILNESVLAYDFDNVINFVLVPFLHKVDVLWKTGTLSQYQSTFAFDSIYRFMFNTLNSVSKYIIPEPSKRVMLFTDENRINYVKLLYAEIIFKKASYITITLRSNDNKEIFDNIDSFKTNKIVTIASLNSDIINEFLKFVNLRQDLTFYFIDTDYRIDVEYDNLIIINNLDELTDEVY